MPRTILTARKGTADKLPTKLLASKTDRDRRPIKERREHPRRDPSQDSSNGAHPAISKEQDTYSGTDPAAIYVRRSPRIKSKVSATKCPLADAGTHASRSSSAALQLIETAKNEQRTMADRWNSAVAGVHKQCDHKPVVPAVKSEGHSGGTTTSPTEVDSIDLKL